MAHIYADEDFPGPAARRLRELGHDVLTVREAGNADRQVPDHEVVRFAHGHGRAVLTLNRRDFIRLHNRGVEHSGIIVCTEDKDFLGLAARIDQTLRVSEPLAGKLIRIIRRG
jgi:predicted nuclease of predicted toxin-antitoxin system